MVSNKNVVNPGGHPGPVTHVGQSHSAKTFNGSHLLNAIAEQPILNAWKASGCQRIAKYLKRGSTNIVYGSNV